MIEIFLALFGLNQASRQNTQEKYLKIIALLAGVERNILHTRMKIDYELLRLRTVCVEKGLPEQDVLQTLHAMRQVCDAALAHHKQAAQHAKPETAKTEIILKLEQWAATVSLGSHQVDMTVQLIEQAISSAQQRTGYFVPTPSQWDN